MGLLERLAELIEVPYIVSYQCSNCDCRVGGPEPSCPECGEELEAGEPEASVYYWGYM
jgi:hypothetical protein